MPIPDVVADCSVEWRDSGHGPTPGVPRSASNGAIRKLRSVEVRRTAADTFEFTRPRSGEVVVKRISGKHVEVRDPQGGDVLARWAARREAP